MQLFPIVVTLIVPAVVVVLVCCGVYLAEREDDRKRRAESKLRTMGLRQECERIRKGLA